MMRLSIAVKSMSCVTSKRLGGVTLLTLSLALTLALGAGGCAYVNRHFVDTCKSRAYIGMSLPSYIKARFDKNSPVRMAVIPFTVPANLSFNSAEQPGLGYELARKVQSELLPTEMVPIIEVFNRPDWPGKKDEFFTGNFGAIALARDAGYDLALVGQVDSIKTLDSLSVNVKIIEVESGVTVYYGQSYVASYKPEYEQLRASLWLTNHTPSKIYISDLTNEMGRCIVHGIKKTDE